MMFAVTEKSNSKKTQFAQEKKTFKSNNFVYFHLVITKTLLPSIEINLKVD